MSDESVLREKAREAVQAGTLPNRRPDRTWGGRGEGVACAICGAPVKDNEFEIEIEFARNDGDPNPETYHVHIRCFEAWDVER